METNIFIKKIPDNLIDIYYNHTYISVCGVTLKMKTFKYELSHFNPTDETELSSDFGSSVSVDK